MDGVDGVFEEGESKGGVETCSDNDLLELPGGVDGLDTVDVEDGGRGTSERDGVFPFVWVPLRFRKWCEFPSFATPQFF